MKKLQLRPLSCGCVAHVPYCLNCGLETCPQDLYNGMYCPMCKDKICSGERMSYSAECAIPGCPNRTDQGDFRGDFCAPCFRYIVTGEGRGAIPLRPTSTSW